MSLQALINTYHIVWRELCVESARIQDLSQKIIALYEESAAKSQTLIALHQQSLETTRVSLYAELRRRERSGRSKPFDKIQRDQTEIDKNDKDLKETQAKIANFQTRLRKYESFYFYSAVKMIALIAATIFGFGAAFGLLVTGAGITGLALVGLTAAFCLMAREVFFLARNVKRIHQTDWAPLFHKHFHEIPDREVRMQVYSEFLIHDMLSKRWIRPFAHDVFRHFELLERH